MSRILATQLILVHPMQPMGTAQSGQTGASAIGTASLPTEVVLAELIAATLLTKKDRLAFHLDGRQVLGTLGDQSFR